MPEINGHPHRFVRGYTTERNCYPRTQLAKKKEVYSAVPFNGDKPSEVLKHHLSKAIGGTYPAAYLRVVSKTKRNYSSKVKDVLPHTSQSLYYQFSTGLVER